MARRQVRDVVFSSSLARVAQSPGNCVTEIHGFPGIAFEVTQSGDVETVWLF